MPQLENRDAKDFWSYILALPASCLCVLGGNDVAAAGCFCEQCQDGVLNFMPTHRGDSSPGDYGEAPKWKGTKARTNCRPKEFRKMGVEIVYFCE